MSGHTENTRYTFSNEQAAVVKKAIAGGLTGTGKAHHEKLVKLQKELNLPMSKIKKKVNNSKRRKQKKKATSIPSATSHGKKSHFSGLNLFSREYGSISSSGKERQAAWCIAWNNLTDEQREEYNSRAKALKERSLTELSPSEKEQKIKQTMNSIKGEVMELEMLGMPAFCVFKMPDGLMCHSADEALPAYQSVKKQVHTAFHQFSKQPSLQNNSSSTANYDLKTDLRKQLQAKLAKVYGEHLGGPPRPFPYAAFKSGSVSFRVVGLPPEVPTLRFPGNMGLRKLKAMMKADIQLQDKENVDVLPMSSNDEQRGIMHQQPQRQPLQDLSVQGAADRREVIHQETGEEQHSTAVPQPSTSRSSQDTPLDAHGYIGHILEETYTDSGELLLTESHIAGQSSSDEEMAETPSPSESIEKALKIAKDVQEKRHSRKTPKSKQETSFMSDLLGKRVKQLYTLTNKRKRWYNGTVVEKEVGQYGIHFDGDKGPESLTECNAKELLECNLLKILKSSKKPYTTK